MDRDYYLRIIRGDLRGPIPSLWRFGLRALAVPYRGAVEFRNLAYDLGWSKASRAAVPVISIGNISVGGTGKTPMVEFVCRVLRDQGVRVATLSRGYGGSTGLNDEGLVLDQNLPDVPQLQNPDRVELARIAVEELEMEILVLDDGFQHRRIHRDLDLVLIDALDPFGQGALLPGGLLREPIRSLRRADCILLTRADQVQPETRALIRTEIERFAGSIPIVEARHAPQDLIDAEGRSETLDQVQGASVAAFSGIGNPGAFRTTLEQLGAELTAFRVFPDHHRYDRNDVESLRHWASESGASLVLTTQKDSVKLRLDQLDSVPLRALRIGMELLSGAEVVHKLLGEVSSRGPGRIEPPPTCTDRE